MLLQSKPNPRRKKRIFLASVLVCLIIMILNGIYIHMTDIIYLLYGFLMIFLISSVVLIIVLNDGIDDMIITHKSVN